MRSFWKVLAIYEGVVILSGMALALVYAGYRTGALPHSVKDVLSLAASVAVLGLFLGGFIGWAIVLSMYCDRRREGG